MQLFARAAVVAVPLSAAVAVALTVGGTPARGTQAASRHRPVPAVAASPGRAAVLPTTRTFRLGAGRATRTFTFRERGGVVLVNQLTVRRGVRVLVDGSIPHVAGAAVWSWRRDGFLACRRDGALEVCGVSEECPVPRAIWRFRLVKVGGPAGPVRFEFLVAPPRGS